MWTEDERPMIRPERLHRGSLSTCAHSLCGSDQTSCCPSPPHSPECVIDSCDAWLRPDSSHPADACSVYTDDSEQQSHFHSLSLWSQLLRSPSAPIADPSRSAHHSSAAHPPPQHFVSPPAELPDAAACAPPAMELAGEEEEGVCTPWADARGWSDAEQSGAGPFGDADLPDPFALDWPAW